MQKTDMALIHWQDVPAAIGLLTRLPVPVDMDLAQKRGAKAAWAYPIAGAPVVLCQVLVASFCFLVGIPTETLAVLILACGVIVTGAMHEDGLADTADGLWGGWDRDRRLEIMKDSRIGAYGVIALVLALLLRWLCLAALMGSDQWIGCLIAVALISRAAMVAVMAGLPNARENGLSRTVGRPTAMTAWIAIGVAIVACFASVGLFSGTLILVAAAVTSLCAGIARRKIGGQTGDILGGVQQVVEIALLLTVAAVI